MNSRNRLDRIQHEVTECTACERLITHCRKVARTKRRAYMNWDYWGRPVPALGDPQARVLLVGLAPGAHGANRTGRMFTGDSSGDFLFRALHRAGLASQPTSDHIDDGLQLTDCYITAVARCAPPLNRLKAAEIAQCLPFLERELDALDNLRVLVTLGRVAFDNTLKALERKGIAWTGSGKPSFTHDGEYELGRSGVTLVTSYHPSRQNTQTGRLTEAMFDNVFQRVRRILKY